MVNTFQVKGWYKVGEGPETIEDSRRYNAITTEEAVRLAREDGLESITSTIETRSRERIIALHVVLPDPDEEGLSEQSIEVDGIKVSARLYRQQSPELGRGSSYDFAFDLFATGMGVFSVLELPSAAINGWLREKPYGEIKQDWENGLRLGCILPAICETIGYWPARGLKELLTTGRNKLPK